MLERGPTFGQDFDRFIKEENGRRVLTLAEPAGKRQECILLARKTKKAARVLTLLSVFHGLDGFDRLWSQKITVHRNGRTNFSKSLLLPQYPQISVERRFEYYVQPSEDQAAIDEIVALIK